MFSKTALALLAIFITTAIEIVDRAQVTADQQSEEIYLEEESDDDDDK